ncbi:hypothetical protein SBOR_5449 [Sclerotinia borealis F-4128]|uniref:Cyanovirin-N domain-containing protein n=1 Tax=Sclerotinia borealis (strain F-4128) TaxID=1432307 RepID=W9CE73_SCLBF|nr:hypothetical protein SBOR_5449 [Sclerotinia borealis F-4128]
MFRRILIIAWIISICFSNNVTSNKIALTGSRPRDPSAVQTSPPKNNEALMKDFSTTKAPAPTRPPRGPEFHLAKRQSYVQSCGNYQIPGFSLKLNMGQTCLVDENGLMFGDCSNRITDGNDCGWAEVCVDSHACVSSCGRTSVPNLSVTTCGGNGNEYCAMWYLVSETYIYTSIMCSDSQSWLTFDATYVTTLSDDFNGYTYDPSEATPASTSSTLTISVGNPSATGNGTSDTNLDSSHSLGAIMGGAFGGLGAVTICCGLLWFYHRHRESKKRASRALAYDPAHSSSDDPEPPNVIGSGHPSSIHHSIRSPQSVGSPAQGYPMSYMESPLRSPNLEDGSVHTGGIRTPRVLTPVLAPSVSEMFVEDPVYELHTDPIGPSELPA